MKKTQSPFIQWCEERERQLPLIKALKKEVLESTTRKIQEKAVELIGEIAKNGALRQDALDALNIIINAPSVRTEVRCLARGARGEVWAQITDEQEQLRTGGVNAARHLAEARRC